LLTGVLGFRRETAQGVVILGVAVLLGEEEDVDEMRTGTTSTVAKFSGRGWPEAWAISRRRTCCDDGFGCASMSSFGYELEHFERISVTTQKL
jgi:hypothetical protein